MLPALFWLTTLPAGDVPAQMTHAQTLQLITGHNSLYIKGWPEPGVPELYLSDPSSGLDIRRNLSYALEKSTALPEPHKYTLLFGVARCRNPYRGAGHRL